jgi:NAD(P)H-flavin reductase
MIKSPDSPYLPTPAFVERVIRITEHERLFRVKPDGVSFAFDPGQFFMAGIPGYGEGPFSVAAPQARDGSVEFCIRAVGNLTNAIHRLTKGDTLWIRGPFGRGFKTDEFEDKDMLFVAGGIGMVPMRSLVLDVLNNRERFGELKLIYGCRSPEEFLFTNEIEEWSRADVRASVTVDTPGNDWHGSVGVVTTLMPSLRVDPPRTVAVVIGPPVMYRFVILNLRKMRIAHHDILLSLERRMKCGLGKCGHCQINSSYVCQEGPVYRLSELGGLYEALD